MDEMMICPFSKVVCHCHRSAFAQARGKGYCVNQDKFYEAPIEAPAFVQEPEVEPDPAPEPDPA